MSERIIGACAAVATIGLLLFVAAFLFAVLTDGRYGPFESTLGMGGIGLEIASLGIALIVAIINEIGKAA